MVLDGHSKPAGQSKQEVAPARLYFPTPHGDCCVEVQEYPASHEVHDDEVGVLENSPANTNLMYVHKCV